MRAVTDMLGRLIHVPETPQRIVSLVPSQTELLYDLGLDERVVGITKFCVHPDEWFRNKARVGGTKKVDVARVAALKPDLILANKEENVKEQIDELGEIAPVWVSDIHTLEDSLRMIEQVGRVCDEEDIAHNIAGRIREQFGELRSPTARKSVAYCIWRDPWMWAGGDTFINNMLVHGGWVNALESTRRYPEIGLEALKEYNPDLVFLSSEPYPFKEIHIAEIKAVMPQAKVMLVDGEMFSWYGSRLLKAPAYFAELLEQI